MAASARYSLTKPSPTLRATITAMITALVPPPVSPDTSAAPEQQDQDRVPELAEQHGGGTHLPGGQDVGPEAVADGPPRRPPSVPPGRPRAARRPRRPAGRGRRQVERGRGRTGSRCGGGHGPTIVPRVPWSRSAASSSRPIMAGPPVASTKRQAASTFGPIDPAGNDTARSSAAWCGGSRGLRRAEPDLDPVDVGQDHQGVGVELPGQQGGREVLVDDRLGAAEQAVVRPDDRDPAAAGADHDGAGAQQRPDRWRARPRRAARARPPPGASRRRPARTCQPRRAGQVLGRSLGRRRGRRTWSGPRTPGRRRPPRSGRSG